MESDVVILFDSDRKTVKINWKEFRCIVYDNNQPIEECG